MAVPSRPWLRRPGVPLAVLSAAAALCWGTTLLNGFAFDDDILIVTNPTIKDPALFRANVFGSFFKDTVNEGALFYFRPLVLTTYFLTYQAFGLTPFPYHLTNVLIHLLNGWLALILCRQWFGLRRLAALVASVVFLVHPIQTEAVAWISGRTDLLAATGVLGTLTLAWHWLRRSRPVLLIAIVAVYHVGLLSKELAIATPALLLALAWLRWPTLRRWPHVAARLGYLLGLLALLSLHFMLWRGAALARITEEAVWPTGSAWSTLLTIPNVLALYMRLLVWPGTYTLDYTVTNLGAVMSPTDVLFWLPLLGCAAVGAYGAWLLWHRRAAGAALAWFWITIAPVSHLRPLAVLACERYLYLPAISAAVIVGLAAGLMERSAVRAKGSAATPWIASLRRWVPVAALLSLVCLAVIHLERNRLWRDNFTLFSHALSRDPMNIHKSLVYAGLLLSAGRNKEALAVVETNPAVEDPRLHHQRGMALINLGRTEEGLAQFAEAIREGATFPAVYVHMGEWYLHTGNLQQAEVMATHALRLAAHDASALRLRARIQARQGQVAQALATLDRLRQLHPEHLPGQTEHARLLESQGRTREAVEILQVAHRAAAPTVESLGLLARLEMAQRHWPEAEATLVELQRRLPEDADVLVDLGYVRAQMGRLTDAGGLWRAALDLDPANESARRNLAATAPQLIPTAATQPRP